MPERSYSKAIADAIANSLADNRSFQLSFNEQLGLFSGFINLSELTEIWDCQFKLIKRAKCRIIVGDDCYSAFVIFPVGAVRDDFETINKFNTLVDCINSWEEHPAGFYFNGKSGEIGFGGRISCRDIPYNEVWSFVPDLLSNAARRLDTYSPEILGIISNYLTIQDIRNKKQLYKWSYLNRPLQYNYNKPDVKEKNLKESTEYSGSIANLIKDFLEEDDWRFSFDDELGRFLFDLRLGRQNMLLNYLIRVFDEAYVVYAIFPVGGNPEDEAMLNTLDEFINRCNYGILPGNFQFDRRDGEIRFKYYIDCAGINPSKEIINNSIYTPAKLSDLYSTGILAIIGGHASAEEAIKLSEAD